MKSTQAWVWLTAGVLALGLNGFYHDGGAAWAHGAVDQVAGQVANRTEAVLALASGRADWFAAQANTKTNLLVARNETPPCPFARVMARYQSGMARAQKGVARVQAMRARQEAAFARMEADRACIEASRARMEAAMTRVRLEPAGFDIDCPRVHVSISR
jgi:hypothetical protein